jgi:hypothetical protein
VSTREAVRSRPRWALRITVAVVLGLLLGLAGAWWALVSDMNKTLPITDVVVSPDGRTLEFFVDYGSCWESIGHGSVSQGEDAIWLRGVIREDRRQPFRSRDCAGVGLTADFVIRLSKPLGEREVYDRYDGRVVAVETSAMRPLDVMQRWISCDQARSQLRLFNQHEREASPGRERSKADSSRRWFIAMNATCLPGHPPDPDLPGYLR